MKTFPKDFFWGAATSSYQVEGNNSQADWFAWEIKGGHVKSGQACRHYDLYNEDFDLAKDLHHNMHRLSVEWSRIEPQEGAFSQEAIQHYKDVIIALKLRGIEPMVTLHHFTNPLWFSEKGGWEVKNSVKQFLRFCEVIVDALKNDVLYWITINEPTVYISQSYLLGFWPPQEKSYVKAIKVRDHMLEAHIKAYRLIKTMYQTSNCPVPIISIAHHIPALITCSPTLRNRLALRLRDYVFNFEILDILHRSKTLDFIGLNYYSRQLVDVKGWGIRNIMWDVCTVNHDPVSKNMLGWDIYPKGLYQVLMKLKKYHCPVIITENGICTDDDQMRWEFILTHLTSIHLAMSEGIDVRGYLHWSLLDNFEWDKGFTPHFGLIEVNYNTQKRSIKDSAKKFSLVCQTGILE